MAVSFEHLAFLTATVATAGLGTLPISDTDIPSAGIPAAQTAAVPPAAPAGLPADPQASTTSQADSNDAAELPQVSGAELDCVAKVVFHEAANQSIEGQLAVAQLIVNRTRSALFPHDVCGVVNQRGQFFNTATYRVPHDRRWATALTVARQALSASAPQVVPGALFFHAKYVATPGFMRNRERLAVLGQHVFYR